MPLHKSKIRFNIKIHHYIGLIFTHSKTIKKHTINPNALCLNSTALYINRDNQYPVFKIDSELFKEGFKYKKYIRHIIKTHFKVKSKYIITIKLVNTLNNLHNYMVVLNNIDKLDKGTTIFNTNDDLFHWKIQLDIYKPHKYTTQNNVYSFIQYPSTFVIYPELFTNNVFQYSDMLDLLTTVDFGY